MFEHYQAIRKFSVPLWQWDCPVLLKSHTLAKGKKKGGFFACCQFENLSSQAIASLTISLSCVGKDWFPAPCVESFTYSGLDVSSRQVFGGDVWIPLPDADIQEFSVYVRQARFADGSVWTGSADPLRCIRETKPLSSLGELQELYLWKAAQVSRSPQVCLPGRHNGWWQCGCGEIVLGSSGFCPKCGADILLLIADSDPDYLNTQWDDYEDYLRERAVMEAEERRKAREKAERQTLCKRVAIASSVSAFAVLAAVYGFSVYHQQVVIPQNQYQEASQLLESGQYQEAQAAFLAMGNYQDAPAKAQTAASEIKYREGVDLEKSGDYSHALSVFEALGSYKDSRSHYKECIYQMALQDMENGYYSSAQTWLKKLGYYKDAKELLSQAQQEEIVQQLIQLGAEGKWEEFSNYIYDNQNSELLRREDVQELFQQCIDETPFHLKTLLSPYSFHRSSAKETKEHAPTIEAEQGYVDDKEAVEDWSVLYLIGTVTGGNVLVQERYDVTITWPDQLVGKFSFDVWKDTGSAWTDYINLGSTYTHPPGNVTIRIEQRSTGETVQTYEFYINGNSK